MRVHCWEKKKDWLLFCYLLKLSLIPLILLELIWLNSLSLLVRCLLPYSGTFFKSPDIERKRRGEAREEVKEWQEVGGRKEDIN